MLKQQYRYISAVDGVRPGRPIVEGTRIGVHDVAGRALCGASVDDVVRSFPSWTRSQVYERVAYYEDHQNEMGPLIARQMARARE